MVDGDIMIDTINLLNDITCLQGCNLLYFSCRLYHAPNLILSPRGETGGD
jgi:hypothetical protein